MTTETEIIANQIEDLTQIAEGQSLAFTVGDGKTIRCAVVKTGIGHFSQYKTP